jgi:poly-gamma-glutamate capsule biosynthesis protein CapA/YwtB (metallophosphatase superfamily)
VKTTLRLLAAGDVSFGRLVGQMLLRNPELALFASMDPLFRSTDVRFVNLEGPISDRGTETVSQHNNLVFNGPPISARVLARAGIDIVSTANNHAWDYGEKGLLETLTWLEKEKVLHVGAGATLERAWEPVLFERSGFRLAFVAINDIWNQPHVPGHSARDRVAGMDQDKLVRIVRELRERKDVDIIAVSYHGGVEYQDEPLTRTRDVAIAAIDAGADVFLGHHPHVVQGLSFHRDRPIVYSLGNLLMRMTSAHPATQMGLAVKVEFERGNSPRLFACPVRIFGVDPIPLGNDPQRKSYEAPFMQRLQSVTRRVGKAIVNPFDADGCARVVPHTE